jgi:hypothetical protein
MRKYESYRISKPILADTGTHEVGHWMQLLIKLLTKLFSLRNG